MTSATIATDLGDIEVDLFDSAAPKATKNFIDLAEKGYYEGVVSTHLDAAGKHVLAEEFALREVLTRLAHGFPHVRRAMNHTLREYLSLGA